MQKTFSKIIALSTRAVRKRGLREKQRRRLVKVAQSQLGIIQYSSGFLEQNNQDNDLTMNWNLWKLGELCQCKVALEMRASLG